MDYPTAIIKAAILGQYKSIKDFATASGIPYSSLITILNKGIGGTAIETVIKICNLLGINISQFQTEPAESTDLNLLQMISYYTKLNETGRKEAVKRIGELTLLEKYSSGLEKSKPEKSVSCRIKTAAYSGSGVEIQTVSPEQYEKLQKARENLLKKKQSENPQPSS